MIRKIFLGFLVFLVVVVISNILPIRVFIEGVVVPFKFETKNAEFKITAYPNKGTGVEYMEYHFQKFLKENPDTNDTILYRTFKRNPLKFWNYRFYMTSEMYNYELKN